MAAQAAPVRDVGKLADLNAIVQSVADNAVFHEEILESKPTRLITARFAIPDFADVSATVVDATARTFFPGGHTQQLADFVTCTMDFAVPTKGPTLTLRTFSGERRAAFAFAGRFGDVTVTLSNLCNCVEQRIPKNNKTGLFREDREFRLYYELVKKPTRISRPTPEVAGSGIGGFRPVRCYRPALLTIP